MPGGSELFAEFLYCDVAVFIVDLFCEFSEFLHGETAVVVGDSGEGFSMVDVKREGGFGIVGDIVWDECFKDWVVVAYL
jgi:hypothetical protein